MGRYAKRLFRTLGDVHYNRRYCSWNTSTISGPNVAYVRLNGPFMSIANMFLVAPSFQTAPESYGTNSYTLDFPTTVDKYVLHYVKFKFRVYQNDEDATIDFRLAKVKANANVPPSTSDIAGAWGAGRPSTDYPVNDQKFTLLNHKHMCFSDPVSVSGSYKNNRERMFEMYFPVNRVYGTRTGNQSVDETDWPSFNDNPLAYTYLFIDTNDFSSADSQYLTVQMWIEWKWAELA